MAARSMRITGLKQALDALGKLPLEITNKVQKKAVGAGARVLQRALALAIVSQGLVRTGRMLKTVRIQYHRDELGRTSASIGLKRARIWHLHEFGTRQMRARPFIRPALMASRVEAEAAVTKVVKREIVALARKKARR